jgi:ABC-type cobalamin/Fe3+-siderophores transport system ATPase subunit
MNIQLPTKKGTPNSNPNIEINQLVIVGANGSGKTRFGSRIEETNLQIAHRISAQKSLTFPTQVSPTSRERAELIFKYGNFFNHFTSENQYQGQKISQRWNGNLNTSLLNDFDKLLVLLHTEEYEDSLSYKEGRIAKPITKLDRVQRIWEAVLPHRKLFKTAGVIETYPTGEIANKYNASEMSDGERVIFYLIAEIICASQNSIIIIDEPEMHIHKSLTKMLYDLIEIERPDCSFIYLTHDIDFAFSRQNAVKIWTKSYEGNNVWNYEILDDSMPIPEQLYLEVLGSRNPVLFIEGDNSSIDYEIYEQVYSNHTIKPLGSCDKVIQTVKSFNEQIGFHNIQSHGIIDRDRRQDDDIVRLNKKDVWVLDVAEAENLLLLEEIVRAISNHMGKNPDDIFGQVKQNLIDFFSSQLESQILIHLSESLRREMIKASKFEKNEIADVIAEVDASFNGIDKQNIFDTIKANFEQLRNTSDYQGILRVFNLKNALIPESKVCELTGIKNRGEYRQLVTTLLKRKDEVSAQIATSIDQNIIKNAT